MLENPYKFLRVEFEFTEGGYLLTQETLANEFHDKEKPYYCDTLTHSAIRKIETNKRNVSDFEMNAYRLRFNTTSDFLLGFTKVPYGKDEDMQMIERITGLSYNSIIMLKILTSYRHKYKNFTPGLGADIDAINALLEYEYEKAQKSKEYIPSWSIFHYIRQYLSSGVYEREMQDRLRVWNDDETSIFDIKENDFLIQDGQKHIIKHMSAINSKTGGGANPKKMNVYNTQNPKEVYVVEVNKAFQSYSRDNILDELNKIKNYLEEKKKKRK
ncbi:hypothetical protein D3Z36_12720 [Lachnospiraceae bacterium]|nr:hypothetical protein [Lachnospiraceae bacterium]